MAAPQQQQSGQDSSLSPLWITVGILIVLFVVWFYFKAEIVAFIFKIKIWEIKAISFFTHNLADLLQQLKIADPNHVSPELLAQVCTAVGDYLRYPITLIFIIFSVILLTHSINYRYNNIYNMEKLVASEKNIWPQITPPTTVDLIEEDLNTGPWAMSKSPMRFALENQLVKEEAKEMTEGMLTRHVSLPVLKLLKGKAHQCFALQLGREWSGVQAISIHAQALFAVFAAKAHGDDKGARKLLAQISASTASGKLNFQGTKQLLNKYKNSDLVKDVEKKHAYEYTVLATMLEMARLDGVLASAEFLWLKPMDRTLWYMLNTVGRQTAVPEIAGVFAHWLSEKELGKKLIVPMVDEAVNGLEAALNEIIYVPGREY